MNSRSQSWQRCHVTELVIRDSGKGVVLELSQCGQVADGGVFKQASSEVARPAYPAGWPLEGPIGRRDVTHRQAEKQSG